MMYSPKLKKATAEIAEILEKYDIAGIVMLHTEGGLSEYLVKIDPSYSIAKLNNGGEEIRLLARLQEDFNGDKKLMKYKVIQTANMLNHFADVGGNLILGIISVSEQLDELVNAQHSKGIHVSQRDLDN